MSFLRLFSYQVDSERKIVEKIVSIDRGFVPKVDLHFVLGFVVHSVRTADLRLDVLWEIPKADDAGKFLCSLFVRLSVTSEEKIFFQYLF